MSDLHILHQGLSTGSCPALGLQSPWPGGSPARPCLSTSSQGSGSVNGPTKDLPVNRPNALTWPGACQGKQTCVSHEHSLLGQTSPFPGSPLTRGGAATVRCCPNNPTEVLGLWTLQSESLAAGSCTHATE